MEDFCSPEALHIDAHLTSSPMDCEDLDHVEHKMLSMEDMATPTGVEPFFDQGVVFATPSPIKRASYWTEETLLRFHQANHARLQQLQQHSEARMEPSNEPCTEEIPWPELVYWLGNSSTGQVECPCTTCQFERSQGRVPTGTLHHPPTDVTHPTYVAVPPSVYKRLSAKIPVIAVPRIEGVN